MSGQLPAEVVDALAPSGGSVRVTNESSDHDGTGAATGSVAILDIEVAGTGGTTTVSIVRKRLRPVTSGRHAAGAAKPRHWAYWRRESEAYASGLLPNTSAFRAPRLLGVVGDDIYLEWVTGAQPTPETAAAALATWHHPRHPSLERSWLAEDQLAARLSVNELSWSDVDADPRMADLWARRDDLLARLLVLPKVLSHGDFSLGNLVVDGSRTIAIDWATLGWEPIGFDLGHLALSSGTDPTEAFLAAVELDCEADAVREGCAITVALAGASRTHWMLTRGIDPPPWYTDFVWTAAAALT